MQYTTYYTTIPPTIQLYDDTPQITSSIQGVTTAIYLLYRDPRYDPPDHYPSSVRFPLTNITDLVTWSTKAVNSKEISIYDTSQEYNV